MDIDNDIDLNTYGKCSDSESGGVCGTYQKEFDTYSQ